MVRPNYMRVLAILTAMTAAALVAGMMASGLASAQTGTTFTVNSTNDPGTGAGCDATECSLREAITAANNNPGADTIEFDIPGTGMRTIYLQGPPQVVGGLLINDTVTIDGYSQLGAAENTKDLTQGDDASLLIELDGTSAGSGSPALIITGTAPNSVVKGLVINHFGGEGVWIFPEGTGNRIEGNFIGTDATGTQGAGNSVGVTIEGANNTVGGPLPKARNVISGNDSLGVAIAGSSASGNKVEGNFIGTQKDGSTALSNTIDGVRLASGSSKNTVGGKDADPTDNASPANIIAHNGKANFFDGVGVRILFSAKGNSVLGNSIFDNVALGIDLDPPEGVNHNDPKDPDTGPNNLQNSPELLSAATSSITGKLNSRPRKTFTIQFFSNPGGTDEGKTLIGETTVKTNRKGARSFTFTPSTPLTAGDAITATATNNSTGDTSEFSSAVTVS